MVGDTVGPQSDHSRVTVCAKEQQRPSCGGSSEGILDQVGLEDGKSQGEWRGAGGTVHTSAILWPRREGGGFGKLLSPWACRKLLVPSQGQRFGPCLPLHHPSLPQLLCDVPKELQLCAGACDLSLAAVLGWEGPGHPKMLLLGVL